MAAPTRAEQREYVRLRMDADFQFLLEGHGVELSEQFAVAQHYTTIRKFAALADTNPNAQTAIASDFGDATARGARVASLITACEAAGLMRDEESKLKAEAKVLAVQKPLASSDRAALRLALEKVRGYQLGESDEPAAEYIAHKLEQPCGRTCDSSFS